MSESEQEPGHTDRGEGYDPAQDPDTDPPLTRGDERDDEEREDEDREDEDREDEDRDGEDERERP